MKLNNKGMTLMELLVSIILIGIVLTFLFSILSDLRRETENNNYAYNNQVNRTEIIYTIQNDLSKYTLLGIEDASTTERIAINFIYRDGQNGTKMAILSSDIENTELDDTKHYMRYTDYNGEKYSWEMKGAQIDTCGSFIFYTDAASSNYYFRLNIPIYNSVYHERNNKDKNNALDDIEITYLSDKYALITTNGDYLTGNNKKTQNIGYCTNDNME